jgi:Lipopolysaccharide-assembly
MVNQLESRTWSLCLLAGVALVLPSCTSDGHVCLLGYTSRPNYDLSIKTVHVPIFKNLTFRKGLEFDLTQAVVHEIESKTPYKVVSDPACADTELIGTISMVTKMNININPQNEVREANTSVTVLLMWRDLRPGHLGEFLSSPRRPNDPPPGTPGAPIPQPVLIQAEASYIPELGESLTTAFQKDVHKLAVKTVELMEAPW